MPPNETFELAAQISGKDADAAIDAHLRALKHAFAAYRDRSYSAEIDQFSFVLRVDGAVRSWGFTGTDAMRYNRKERYVTADIGVPKTWWEALPPETVSTQLKAALQQALVDQLGFLKQKGVRVDEPNVLADFSAALARANAPCL